MPSLSLLFRTFLYIIAAVLLTSVAVSIKIISSLIAEQLIYKIIIIGDIFYTLEVVEFVNILVFAFLGMGFGLAATLLPEFLRRQTSAVLLIVLVPLIFSVSSVVRYNFWLEEVADKENISFVQAEKLTNSFLSSRVTLNGFLGFYVYTGQFPVLPTNKTEISQVAQLEKKVKSNFLSIHKLTGLKPEIILGLLATGIWTIRAFYFSLAAIATVTHFHGGFQEVAKRAKPTVPSFPPVPPSFKRRSTKPMPPAQPRKVSSR